MFGIGTIAFYVSVIAIAGIVLLLADYKARHLLSRFFRYLERNEKQRIRELEEENKELKLAIDELKKKESKSIILQNDLLENFLNEKEDTVSKELLDRVKRAKKH